MALLIYHVHVCIQGMAYGVQLGIPVIHGLYAAIFFSLIYAIFGGSKETCPANTALVTMMAANALDGVLPKVKIACLVSPDPTRLIDWPGFYH